MYDVLAQLIFPLIEIPLRHERLKFSAFTWKLRKKEGIKKERSRMFKLFKSVRRLVDYNGTDNCVKAAHLHRIDEETCARTRTKYSQLAGTMWQRSYELKGA